MSKPEAEFGEVEKGNWIASFESILQNAGPGRAQELLKQLHIRSQQHGFACLCGSGTAYINTIAAEQQQPYPGNLEIERRIKSFIRWNAMAMVVRANRISSGIGGHISTYASAATLFEVGFNHFFRARNEHLWVSKITSVREQARIRLFPLGCWGMIRAKLAG